MIKQSRACLSLQEKNLQQKSFSVARFSRKGIVYSTFLFFLSLSAFIPFIEKFSFKKRKETKSTFTLPATFFYLVDTVSTSVLPFHHTRLLTHNSVFGISLIYSFRFNPGCPLGFLLLRIYFESRGTYITLQLPCKISFIESFY